MIKLALWKVPYSYTKIVLSLLIARCDDQVKNTVKPVLNGLSKRSKLVFKTYYRLMQVKSIAECSKGSILQYFLPSLSYHLLFNKSFVLSIFEWPLKTGFTVIKPLLG